MKIRDCMEENVYWLKPENTVQDCAKLMSKEHIGSVPVCDEQNTIVGLVTDRDIILRTIACEKDYKTTPISQIMTTKVCCCNADVDVEQAQDLMSRNQIRRLPIVDDENKVIGILTLGDLAKTENTDNNGVYETLETICKCDDKNAE